MPGKVSRRVRRQVPRARAPRGVRRALATLYAAAIAAVDPERVATAALALRGRQVVVRGRGGSARLPLRHGVVVVGAGKGAAGLAAGVESVLGAHVVGGLVIVPPGYERELARITIAYGNHPVPDRRSRDATHRLLAVLAEHPAAAVLVVLTGGASSLLAAPAAGLTLMDEQRTNAWLLASGIDIAGMNAIRKHLSAIKGGRLAERLVGRPAVAVVVSDVPGDDLTVIGSGPTVGDPTTFAEALAIMRAAGTARRLPGRVFRHLERGARGRLGETPKPGSPVARACPTLLVAANATARAAAVAWARRCRIRTIVSGRSPLGGETVVAAKSIARRIRRCQGRLRGELPALVIAGGETTVRLGARSGRGGRNQEVAVAVAAELAGIRGWAVLAAGTDGIDGPTDAAGAFADGATWARAHRSGRSLADALDRHDVYPCLAGLGDLFAPGPTGTNVGDLVFALVWKDRGWRLPPRMIQTLGRR